MSGKHDYNFYEEWDYDRKNADEEWEASRHDRNMQWESEHRDSQTPSLIKTTEDKWGCLALISFVVIGSIISFFGK